MLRYLFDHIVFNVQSLIVLFQVLPRGEVAEGEIEEVAVAVVASLLVVAEAGVEVAGGSVVDVGGSVVGAEVDGVVEVTEAEVKQK